MDYETVIPITSKPQTQYHDRLEKLLSHLEKSIEGHPYPAVNCGCRDCIVYIGVLQVWSEIEGEL